MPIQEAIILAGGLGTRLREAVPDLPKCLAPVHGKPFLHYIIHQLTGQGINKLIFSVGYKSELIKAYLATLPGSIDWQLSVEDEPLGTGGAVRLASHLLRGESALVLNGDTYFDADLGALDAFHQRTGADCTLCLKPMRDFNRYGVVRITGEGIITGFEEKKQYAEGLINGGLYALQREALMGAEFPERFSFEKDYLEKKTGARPLYGLVQDGYFIDIGIPSDYEKADREWKQLVKN